MTSERIKEIQEQTAYPESRSVMLALKQVWNECEQEQDSPKYSDKEVKHLMTLAFEQGFKKADVVEAGLEAKETDTEVNWIFLKHKK